MPTETSIVADSDAHWDRYWTLYLRLGLGVLAAESAASGVYFAAATLAHREVLVGLAATTLTVSACGLFAARRVAARSWRPLFVQIMALTAGVVACACCALDGGFDSPLVSMLALPVLYMAMQMPVSSVVVGGTVSFAELTFLVLTDAHLDEAPPEVFIAFVFLGGVVAISIVAAAGRTRVVARELAIKSDLAHLAETDPLTGCLNSRGFFSRLETEMARAARHGSTISLLIVDIDLFKRYNDSHGHDAGNRAIAAVGQTLSAISRRSDVVARIGGDEFAVMLPVTPVQDAVHVAQRICDAVAQHPDARVTISAGAAELDPSDPSVRCLFREADAALYRAKAAGRARVVGARLDDSDDTREPDRPGDTREPDHPVETRVPDGDQGDASAVADLRDDPDADLPALDTPSR